MKPTKPLFSTLLAVFLIAGFTHSSLAEVETIKIEMFGFVTNEGCATDSTAVRAVGETGRCEILSG